jgi:1,4-dihydroxy-2-naphthoyl-CoA synthase
LTLVQSRVDERKIVKWLQTILYEVKDYVATITINRPKVLNACTGDNFDEIGRLVDQAGADRRVGVIVITGVGERSFCASRCRPSRSYRSRAILAAALP